MLLRYKMVVTCIFDLKERIRDQQAGGTNCSYCIIFGMKI